jgi:hypothetical protein
MDFESSMWYHLLVVHRAILSTNGGHKTFRKYRQALRNGSNNENVRFLPIPVIRIDRMKHDVVMSLQSAVITSTRAQSSPIAKSGD